MAEWMRSRVQILQKPWTQPCVELRCLNIWVLIGGTVWVCEWRGGVMETSAGTALLEEECHALCFESL